MTYMKASSVLAEARHRIAIGHDIYCCLAIKTDHRRGRRDHYPAVSRAMSFFRKYKPEVTNPDGSGAWWDKYDIESRLSALRKAEHDAIVAGDYPHDAG
ncbi:hypothetical protein FHW67_003254 [Herbaspirillum sp. Sphag1AN]|nr:hypothetical protein [Herbaspirillum sp. Sphag1AN]MBB3247145.1 hypothetical protein [Herbaspirillum sp. Sphag64]